MRWMTDRTWTLCGLALALASCGMADGKEEGRSTLAASTIATTRVPMVSDMPVRVGRPYKVRGVTYSPADDPAYDEVGYASWYGEELAGNRTASGERFLPTGVSAAHRTLPLPSYVEVTSLDTGRTILVRINDRGPFSADRLIDLSRGAAEQLGISGHGHAAVRVRRVDPPAEDSTLLRSGRRAAERMEAPQAMLLGLRQMLNEGGGAVEPEFATQRSTDYSASLPALPAGKAYVVQAAAFSSEHRAGEAADRIGGFVTQSGDVWRVRLGPFTDAASARQGVQQAAASGFQDARIMVND